MAVRKPLVLSAAQLAAYQQVDARLPQLILEFSREEQRREFWYAIAGMLSGVILAILVFGGFVYLVIRDHATAAGSLLGVGVLT